MTHVHYKFSSKLSYDTVVFDGPRITLRDLKKQIMGREKLSAGDCDLQITNAQTKQEYTDDEGLIPKGSSVIVRRIPISGGKSSSSSKTHHIQRSDAQFHHAFGAVKAMNDQSSSSALPFFSKMANLAVADVSEEDKIKVMLNQSTYDAMNYSKKFGSVLPANYTCHRCGNTGHHIKNCPTSGEKNFEAPVRIKKSTGIPRSFLVEVDDPSVKGAMLTNCGRYAIPAIDAAAYAIGKKERPPFVPQEQPKSEAEDDPVPDELLCLICRDLLSDAVVIPCCGNSYCDDCIRTTLLDSEDHICPNCSKSEVSPDTLIANKFLRQAVNTFKKERGYPKSLKRRCDSAQSQNPTPTLSPVPAPPPLTVQSQPQKPHLSTFSQQDSFLHRPQAADTLPLSGNPSVATGPASACNTPITSLQPEQSCLEIPDKEAEGETHDDSAAAAAPSVLVSNKGPGAAPSQLIPLVNHSAAAEQPQVVSVNQQQSSTGPSPRYSRPSACWGSSSSSSVCPTGGWTESQPLTSSSCSSSTSSTYSAATPPLFPSPVFHPYLSAHQSHSSYPPGYPPTTPIWTLPSPQGTPIPSLCSSTPTSSIPALIPNEWYRHQRKKKERSPHRGSTYRRSSSRSNSKSKSKSKSSRSYSRSSSRSGSRSRSRSQGRSRPRSPYSNRRDFHTRSHPSHSYSYGYKRSRSPTPSSSSSPQVGYHSRSKSPSDHRKNRHHHSRHHTRKSASSSYSSRRRGEHSETDVGGSGSLNAPHSNQTSSLELDRERYLQWKKEYKEWCDKYFSSYVGHFHQLPLPFINLPPPPQWEESKDQSHANSSSHYRRPARTDGRSPPSQSSSDSRSPPSQSSSDSRSTPSQSSSDSRSSPSHTSNDSRSPPSQSSSDGRSTPSEHSAQLSAHQQQDSHLPVALTKGSKEAELQERGKDDKQGIKSMESICNVKYEPRRMKKHEERGEEPSSPHTVDSNDESRKDKGGHNTGPHFCKDGISVQDKATASDTLKSVQVSLKPDKSLDKDCERKSRQQRYLEGEKGWRGGKDSDSRQDVERQTKVKPSKETDRVDSDRYRSPGGSQTPDLKSEKNRKRRGEHLERNETHKSDSPNPFDGKKQKTEKKKERKTWPLTERDIWEGGITVKPQKKISININLDGKRKEEKSEKQESIVGKSKEESEKTVDGAEEKLNRGGTGVEVDEKKESSREKAGVFEEKPKPDQSEVRQSQEKATYRDVKRAMWKKITEEKEDVGEKREDREGQDFDLWHCALRGVKEEKNEREKAWEEGDGKKAGKGGEGTGDGRRSMTGREEEEEREFVPKSQRERTVGESTYKENRKNPPGELKPKEAPMEGAKRRVRKEEGDARRFESQGRSDESHHYDGSSCGDCQERRTVVKTLEEYTQDRGAEREDQLVLIQVPRSKWENEESEEEEQKEGEITAQDPLPAVLPPPLVETPTTKETEGENEQKRQGTADGERDRDRGPQRGRDREKEKNLTLPRLDRSVAPPSGKDRPDSASCTDGEKERRTEMERWRDRERGRESERPRDRQKERKRSKERKKEEERGGHRGRERGHGSTASVQKKNLPSSDHFSSYSASQEIERRDRQRGGDQDHEKSSNSLRPGSGSRERSSMSRGAELPGKHAHKTYRDTLDKDKKHPNDQHNQRDPSGNYRHQGRPGTHHSSPSCLQPHSQGEERDPLPSESPGPKPRMSSPGRGFMQNRGRHESKDEEEEWKRNKVDKMIRESKRERERREMDDEADKSARETKLEGGRELEEGERPSSSGSSSASQEDSKDDRRTERKKKQKTPKNDKSQDAPELLEEGELKKPKHKKKSQRSEEGREEESGGEVNDGWKEEEDHAALCSVMLS